MTIADPASEALLLGTISIDRYLASGEALPGGGVLNMAWHWRRLGRPFRLLTRVGLEDGRPILEVLDRLAIVHDAAEIAIPGRSSSIDIEILADRQPHMDNFVPGVWDGYRLTPRERALLVPGRRLHAVLVEGAIAEVERLGDAGALDGVEVSADFLGFRHYTVERFALTMRHVDVGIVGWPGPEDDPVVGGMREVVLDQGKRLVVTMGARAVLVVDGRAAPGSPDRVRRFDVTPVPVAGTTLGCGDAFIAWFLDALWRSGDIEAAVRRGMIGGAMATAWPRPIPDDAYDLATPSARPA